MEAQVRHSWDLSPREAAALQRELAPRVITTGQPATVTRVAGADISIGGRFNARPGRGAVVVLSYPDLKPVEQSVVEQAVTFPYVPGLLSFREIPVLLPAFERLRTRPDLLIVDGQGRAHPRRMGLACHLGLVLDVPAIGCAKSKLLGEFAPLGDERGSVSYLYHQDEVIGAAVRTRAGTKPVFVSVGHRISLENAIEWILNLAPRYRVPEPTRLADQAAAGRIVADGTAVEEEA